MKVVQLSTSDIKGGAARASYRIHRCLVDHGSDFGVESWMRVLEKVSSDPSVVGGRPAMQGKIWRHLQPRLYFRSSKGFQSANRVLHSAAWPATGLGRELASGDSDLLHLHWVGLNLLSIEEIGALPQPLVWTLHDQWAFCGAEHYVSPPPETDVRFIEGYSFANRPDHERGPDLNRRVWERKCKAWKKPMQIVCPSHWMANCARRSALMRDWPVSVIPYPIDLTQWAPCSRSQARTLLNLPPDPPLILFGALGGTSDPRKGSDLLQAAMQRLGTTIHDQEISKLELVIFGQSKPSVPHEFGFPVHYLGHLHDDISLRLVYSAADVFVLPSRQDNLPNTGLEAHACGTPVVAFNSGGLPDIVEHQVTGALATPFDPESLAAAIVWVLEDQERLHWLGSSARRRAEQIWNPTRIASLYADVYRQASRR